MGTRLGFGTFVAVRLPARYRYALVLTRDRHEAEDLVHDALLDVS